MVCDCINVAFWAFSDDINRPLKYLISIFMMRYSLSLLSYAMLDTDAAVYTCIHWSCGGQDPGIPLSRVYKYLETCVTTLLGGKL